MAPSAQLLAAAAWLTGLAAALPAPAPHDGTADLTGDLLSSGKASLQQVRREDYKFNGPVSMYKTYLKHGVSIPQYLDEAVARTGLLNHSTGTVLGTPLGPEYSVPVSVGTPPQVLRLLFDTSSADTWGFSTLMPNSQVNGQTRYDPNKSSTAELQVGSTWSRPYADGTLASGVVYNDTVDVAGISVENQAFGAVKNVSDFWTGFALLDGVLGLGLEQLSTVLPHPVKTFMDNAKAKLDAPLFTVDLKHKSPGTYNFGFIDPASHEGNVTYTPVYPHETGFWNFSSSGFAIGNDTFQPAQLFVIADTGAPNVYLPRKAVQIYYARVRGAFNSSDYGGWVFPCNSTTPSFTFGIDEAHFTIPGNYFNTGPVDQTTNETCYGGLQWAGSDRISIFGEIALKAALVVFKYPVDENDSPTLGWATKKLA